MRTVVKYIVRDLIILQFDNHWNLIMCCVFCSGDGDENSSDDDDDYSLSDQEASDSGGDAVSTANLVCFISVCLDHDTKILFSSLTM